MKKFTVILGGFSAIERETPYDAAKNLAHDLTNTYNPKNLVYTVIDEQTKEAFTVDLSEEIEDATLPLSNALEDAKKLIIKALSSPLDDAAIAECQTFLKNN